MGTSVKLLFLALFLAAAWAHDARADRKTVCTITVNSPDEKETFRRYLPADKFRFVELVEHGRPDWLASACQQHVRCDVLVISGHYDGGHEFFSDRVEAREFLPVDEMERVSCSDSCPGLFSQLKEVYLFGCNTLNPEAQRSAAGEIERTLVRSGIARADAQARARTLSARHGESSRDRMRLIFDDVPAIYGFSSVAPLGPTSASILARYFRSGGGGEIGSGQTSARLLGTFSGHSLTVTRGLSAEDPGAAHRQDVCQFADDRSSPAQKLGFVHRLLDRDPAEARLFLDRLENLVVSLPETERQTPAVSRALDEIARDQTARGSYLAFARNTEPPAVRARMLSLAQRMGWLTPAQTRAELMRMIDEEVAANAVGPDDVDLVCSLNEGGELDTESPRLRMTPAQARAVPNAAVLACLGNPEGHARVVQALASASDDEVRIAQVYLRHRPIADVDELRAVTAEIARMSNPKAQARALETLARLGLSDRESLEELTRLFPLAESAGVQTAIAGVLLRADADAITDPELVRTLRQSRLQTASGTDAIDVLIRRLEAR